MIQVTKKWFIDSEGYQYILFKKEKYFSEKDNEWKERISDKSYHATVSLALNCLIKKMQKKFVKENDVSLEEAIKKFQKIENIVLKSVSGNEF